MSGLSDFNDLEQLHGPGPIHEAIRAAAYVDDWAEPTIPTGTEEESVGYPMDALPPSILAAAGEVARFSKVPMVSPAVVGLAVAALAIGKKARIEERPGHYHHPSLFFAIIADSGERKSPSFKHMTQPLEKWMQEQTTDYQRELAQAKSECAVIDSLVANLKRRAADPKTTDEDRGALVRRMTVEESKRPTLPPSPRMFTSDATEERLFQKLHEHGGAFGVLSGEGRPVLDSIMGEYSGKDRTGDAIYLSGISGDTITRDRVGGENGPEDRVVINPCLVVSIMTQPDKYMEAARHPALRASGALARIWPVRPPSLVGSRLETPGERGLDEEVMRPFQETIISLLAARQPLSPKTGKPIPHLVQLSPEAAEARREWHNIVEMMMGDGQPLEDVRDLAAKAVSATCKAAMVLHLIQNPDLLKGHRSELSLDAWRNAQLLGEYHLGEAIRIQRGSGEDAINASAKRIIRWVFKSKRRVFSVADILQYGPRPRLEKKDAATVLAEMVAMGWVRTMPPGHDERVHRYEANPKLFSHLASLAGVEVK